jgi:hypothetical protein
MQHNVWHGHATVLWYGSWEDTGQGTGDNLLDLKENVAERLWRTAGQRIAAGQGEPIPAYFLPVMVFGGG